MAATTPESSIEKVSDTLNNNQETIPSHETGGQSIPSAIQDESTATQPQSGNDDSIAVQQATIPETTITAPAAAATTSDEEMKPFSKYEQAVQLRDKLDSLIRRTVQTKKKCDKLDHDNKYLQEYVGNLMNSGDFLSKKVWNVFVYYSS